MTQKLTHRTRMTRLIEGLPLDRPPVALWRHFPVDDQSPDSLANAVANFQTNYDFDFIKVTPASSYCLKDWGVLDEWRGNPEGTRDFTFRKIKKPEDWLNLIELDPRSGNLGSMLECLRLLKIKFGHDTPIIQTIFSPLSQAKNLAGQDLLLVHMRTCPQLLQEGLARITALTQNFINEIKKIGIDGIFYAVQHAQTSLLSLDEFRQFGRCYDLEVLSDLSPFWLNIGHIHGKDIQFDQVLDYPVQILNWHDRQTSPSLQDAKRIYPGVICGGLRQWETMVYGTPHNVNSEATDAFSQTNSEKFILGTGCVLPIIAPHGNIMAARKAVGV